MTPHIFQSIPLALFCLMFTAGGVAAASGPEQRKLQLKALEREWRDAKPPSVQDRSLTTLDDYLAAGLARSPSLKMAFYEWKAASQEISQAFSLPDPQLSYTVYSEDADKDVAYGISQVIPWLEKLWIRRSMAVSGSDKAYYAFEAERLELIRRITEAYYEYAYLSKAVLITRENMQLLSSFESVAQSKYASGLTKNQDLLKIQLELGKLENELASLEDLRLPVMAGLNAMLHQPVETLLPWPEDSLESAASASIYEDVTALMERVQAQNPELVAAEKSVESRAQGVRLAKKGFIPDFMLGVTQEKMSSGAMGDEEDIWMVMVSVNVPLWFGRIRAEIREEEATLRGAEEAAAAKGSELTSGLALTHYKLRDALRQSRLYRDALIPKAVQTLNATRSAYEAGEMDFLSLIDAQRMLLDFQLIYYRQNADSFQRLADIQTLIGEAVMTDSIEGDAR